LSFVQSFGKRGNPSLQRDGRAGGSRPDFHGGSHRCARELGGPASRRGHCCVPKERAMRLRRPLLGLALVVLAACGDTEPAPPPPPVEVTGEATGHYCGMLLQDHEGPKGQIHLVGREEPIWFSSVRD